MSDDPMAGPFTPEQEARIRELIASMAGQRPEEMVEVTSMHASDALLDRYFDGLVAPEKLPPRPRSKFKRLIGWLHRIAAASCPSFIPSLPTDYVPAPLKAKLFSQDEFDRYAEFQLKPLGLWAEDDQTSPQSEQSPSARRDGHAQ